MKYMSVLTSMWKTPSKNCERKLRGAVDSAYAITGPDQTIRQSGKKLLTNGVFKNELAKFILREWKKEHNSNFLNGKTLFVSYGGDITNSNVIVRASDTDVLLILISAHGQQRREVRAMTNILMDCGTQGDSSM